MRTPFLIATSTVLLLTLAWGCNSTDDRLGYEVPRAPAATFGVPEAGADGALEPDASFGVLYCPTSACPSGFTTCEDSRFLCDTDLLSDVRNCGACGHACPEDGATTRWSCVGGECVMQCSQKLDCDGIVDNGCENDGTSNEHCGACNVKCDTSTDPTQACVKSLADQTWQCGCPSGELYCPTGHPLVPGECVFPMSDDYNCGACGNQCDPTGGRPGLPPPNAYFGCAGGECGKIKCTGPYANCDGDVTNGCETPIFSDDNCGGCGVKCEAGTRCLQDDNRRFRCMCPQGTSLCVAGHDPRGFDTGYCADFSSDDENCGGCGNACLVGSPWRPPLPNAREACVNGSCELQCLEGSADCNGNWTDGCETDISSDPRNCGGCGIQCDVAAGQACAAGRCMLAPCEPEEEETTQ